MDPFFEYFKRERKTISQNLYEVGGERHKSYDRFPSISLSEPEAVPTSLDVTLDHRESSRKYTDEPISERCLSTLLYWSLGTHKGVIRRRYPSGGALYPLEPYVCINRGTEKITRGLYHYNPSRHVLETLSDDTSSFGVSQCFKEPFVRDAAALLFFTFLKGRSMPKYGALAYKLGLIEAGHVGQNVYLAAAALNVGVCARGDGDTNKLNTLLGVDGMNECFVYGIALGNMLEKGV